MNADVTQRWRAHRSLYRPAGEVIDPSRYEVAKIDRNAAKAFVREHHYEPRPPADRFRFGLFRGSELVGVAVFSTPCQNAVITKPLGISVAKDGAYLGRFVLLDDVPGNGETWFLARCFEGLRKLGLAGVVSDSDPQERRALDGTVTMPGHVGNIYQAFNGRYLGRTKGQTLRLLPDGTVFSARAMSKVRGRERGWEACAELLVRAGAEPFGGGSTRDWMWRALELVTRPLRHGGNHRYVWGLHRAVTKRFAPSLPFPKAVRADFTHGLTPVLHPCLGAAV